MTYILLSKSDVDFIANRAVICAINDTTIALFEPMPDVLESYFEGRKRFEVAEITQYFIIPLDIVSQIKHYSGWVKEAYPEKIFDVVLGSQEIEVEGQMVIVPTNIIKMIPCGITAFNAEGEMLLDAVIESWNTQVPSKAIDFNVKFYSLSELTQFIESCTNSR